MGDVLKSLFLNFRVVTCGILWNSMFRYRFKRTIAGHIYVKQKQILYNQLNPKLRMSRTHLTNYWKPVSMVGFCHLSPPSHSHHTPSHPWMAWYGWILRVVSSDSPCCYYNIYIYICIMNQHGISGKWYQQVVTISFSVTQ